ncbi:MAG: alpha/beta fold hydrolase [Proteobacteria bacterium]|nr:alpha/beta fold hydrolase [Pseudomonadota bacterium]
MHPRITAALLTGLGLLGGFGPVGRAAAPVPPALVLSPCELEHPLRLTVVPAECGVLQVPENPGDPAGRRIGLRIARVPAISRRKLADPLFVLAGGPGQAASSFYATVAGAFARINRDRDIVLVDQRGTGRSHLLDCPEDEETLYRAGEEEIARSTRACLRTLDARASVGWYTTSIAVQDLEAVRRALGYGPIDLYGVSYGTRVAQHYIRRFPGRVRAVILDGVLPPALAVGPAVALDAEAALQGILARCAQDAPCHARFADPVADYHAVRAALARAPASVQLPDPVSGAPRQLDFGADQLAAVLRLASYSADYAALLPLMLHGAASRADYAPLAAQFLLFQRAYGDIAVGMHNSVVCAEDVPFYDEHAIDRARLAQTFMGAAQVDALRTVCGIWPHGPVDADFHAPLASHVPALLLSGSADPVTPPAYAHAAARGFARARELVLAGFAHGQLTAPCMGRVLARFLEAPDPQALDARCLEKARPMPFFVTLNGPAP